MAKSERRACPLCGTLKSLCCNAVNIPGASRLRPHNRIPSHSPGSLVMVPVFHRHDVKREDHEEVVLAMVAKGFKVHWPLQGYDYTGK